MEYFILKKTLKITVIFIFISVSSVYSQWVQVGQDIDAEGSGDSFGSSVSFNADATQIIKIL